MPRFGVQGKACRSLSIGFLDSRRVPSSPQEMWRCTECFALNFLPVATCGRCDVAVTVLDLRRQGAPKCHVCQLFFYRCPRPRQFTRLLVFRESGSWKDGFYMFVFDCCFKRQAFAPVAFGVMRGRQQVCGQPHAPCPLRARQVDRGISAARMMATTPPAARRRLPFTEPRPEAETQSPGSGARCPLAAE